MQDGNPGYNPHKQLTHVSSLSAPEVNQVQQRVCFPEIYLGCKTEIIMKHLYSNHYLLVLKGIINMRKHTDWFTRYCYG